MPSRSTVTALLAPLALTLTLALSACGSGGDGMTPDPGPGGQSRLSAAALAEVQALDLDRYRGLAVQTGEEDQGSAVRVGFDPASGPICLRGDPYAAFYIDRGSDRTMILLDGGGACWTGLCAASEGADDSLAAFGPISGDPSSFFHDWNVVFAPYCDGSVFAGDNDVAEADGTTRYQRGRRNLAAALDLAEQHFGDSKQILLGGFSAGGYGTILGMVQVRLRYPEADLLVLDDSGPGVQNLSRTESIETRLREWKFGEVVPDSCAACDHGRGQLTAMFSWMLENDPSIRIAVLSYYEDPVIGLGFNGLDGAEYKALLLAETGKVQAAYPDRFKRYMLPGVSHVVSLDWETATADGVPLPAWVAAMVEGDAAVWTDLLATGP